MERRIEIDAVRGGAVALVVFMHAVDMLSPQPLAAYAAVNWLGDAARMPVLLFVSGMLSAGLLGTGAHVFDRAATHLWLFAVWTVITVPFLVFDWNWTFDLETTLGQAVAPTTHLWFIWLLAPLTTMTAFLPDRRALIAATIGLALLSLWGHAGHVDGLILQKASRYSVYFALGLLWGRRVSACPASKRLAYIVGLLGACALVHAANAAVRGWTGTGSLMAVERLLACLAILLVAQAAAGWPVMRPLAWLGRRTMPVYVSHLPLLALCHQVIGDVRLPAPAVALAVGGIGLLMHRATRDTALFWLWRRPGLNPRPASAFPAQPSTSSTFAWTR